MAYLADTNILLRLLEPGTPLCEQARAALKTLRAADETVFVTPQNIVEFWNGATRPRSANGFDLTPAQAAAEVQQIQGLFPLLPETPAIYPEWRRLVLQAGVSGVQVYDARLAAIMCVHRVPHLLTFNDRDFMRFPGVITTHPAVIPEVVLESEADELPQGTGETDQQEEVSQTEEASQVDLKHSKAGACYLVSQ